MDYLDAVRMLSKSSASDTSKKTNAHVTTATATSDSADGKVYVDFGGVAITGDDSQSVELPTTVDVRNGDVVQVTLVGADGTGKSPTVTGVVGGGDRTRSEMVVFIDVEYAISSSGTEAPTSGWQTTAPAQTDEKPYLWTRTVSSTGDGSTVYTTPTLVPNGVDGVGITSVTEQYYLSTSRTELSGGSWADTPTAPADGQYVWTRSVIAYTDGTTTTLDPKSVSGEKGDTGDTGPQGPQGETGPQGEAGADAVTLAIESSDGLIFHNVDVATTLTAHVYRGGTELTSDEVAMIGQIVWYKDGTQTATGATLTVASGSVESKASYMARLEV